MATKAYFKYRKNKKAFKDLQKNMPVTRQDVKGIITRKLETKYADANSLGVLNPTSAGLFTDLFPITQGVSQNQRVGAIIMPKSLTVIGHFAAQATQNVVFRNIHFIWKPDNAVAPTLGNILSNGPSGAPDINSQYNFNNKATYKILSDKRYFVTVNAAASRTSKSGYVFRYTIKKKLLKEMSFSIGLNTGENHIYSLLLTDQALGADSVSLLQSDRLTFKDA